MSKTTEQYQNPLLERYVSKEMAFIFSAEFKFQTWRKLWVALAKAQKKAGLAISDEQIEEMQAHIEDIDFDLARKKEKEMRHDVMAHVHLFASTCPKAAPIIHLGATSAFVGDNTDLIQAKAAMALVEQKLLRVIKALRNFAWEKRTIPTLGYTHFQPAQPTTVGKRACLWIQDLLLDLEELKFVKALPFRGVKGTTGTQASFLNLFEGDEAKVDLVNEEVRKAFGFARELTITGQTYTRKLDNRFLHLLSSIAQTAAKFSTDLRLLAHKKEIEEPFEEKQVGSSAMAYKRNPMRCERMGSLARFVVSLTSTTAFTASTQWFERTLDDSANKRLAIPQAFMAIDAILDIFQNVVKGLVVYEKIIEKNLQEELPFMATEDLLMQAVKNGGNRQEIHAILRVHSLAAAEEVKIHGRKNDLLMRLAKAKNFPLSEKEIETIMDPKRYIGRSISLTQRFLKREVDPLISEIDDLEEVELRV